MSNGASFGIAHEGDARVLRKTLRSCQIDSGHAATGGEIAVDLGNGLAVEMNGGAWAIAGRRQSR